VTTTVTNASGEEKSRTVDVSKDPSTHTVTKDVTATGTDGTTRTRDTTATRTDDGYTRTTDFNNGAETNVTATKSSDGTMNRDVTRTPAPDSSSTDTNASTADDSAAQD